MSRRRFESLRISVPVEAPTKKTRAGTRRKATDAIRDAFASDPVVEYARSVTAWPKPRAAIALDISVTNVSRNGARIDSICKWLLDELTGHVYADDRQVKLLFAHVWRPLSAHDDASEIFWGGPPPWASSLDDRGPQLTITAQTRANVLADLRVASRLEERWDPFDDEHGVVHTDPPLDAALTRGRLLEYQSTLDPSEETERAEYRLLDHQIDFHDQAQQQRLVDLIFSSLLTDLPIDRFGIWGRVRERLNYGPYLFDLGTLPERGQSTAFQQRLRKRLVSRRDQFPGLFPMRASSGISMILFEGPRGGKDLDNLIREVLPTILDVLRPPRSDLPGWIAEEPDPALGAVDIPFIEVAAIPAERADMPPGSLILGLSGGNRHQSWWSLVANHVEASLHDARRSYSGDGTVFSD